MISPVISLLTTIILYAIISVVTSSSEAGAETPSVLLNIIKIILSLLIFACILICVPLGIFFLGKGRAASLEKYDKRSGKKELSDIPDEIKGWSWGAFGLHWIWGVYHNVWISLLIFIPLVNIVMAIMLGIKGKEWAWRAQKWESVDTFMSSQKKWNIAGIIVFIFRILLGMAYFFFIINTNQ